MYTRYHITADSFGSDLPQNWEAIADYLNPIIDETLSKHPEALESEADPFGLAREAGDLTNEIWENYWNGEYPDAPAAIDPE